MANGGIYKNRVNRQPKKTEQERHMVYSEGPPGRNERVKEEDFSMFAKQVNEGK